MSAPVFDPLVSKRVMTRILSRYFTDPDLLDPRFDARLVAAADLPPILIQAGAREMLSADAIAFGDAMEQAGGRCEVQIWPDQIHVFQLFYPLLPEARVALQVASEFITSLVAPELIDADIAEVAAS